MNSLGVHLRLPWQPCAGVECDTPATFEQIPFEDTDGSLYRDTNLSSHDLHDVVADSADLLDQYVARDARIARKCKMLNVSDFSSIATCWRPQTMSRPRDDRDDRRPLYIDHVDADLDLDEDDLTYDPANPEFTRQVPEEVVKSLHEQLLRQQAEKLQLALAKRGASAHEQTKRYREVLGEILEELRQMQQEGMPECSAQPSVYEDSGEVGDDMASENCNRPLESTWTLESRGFQDPQWLFTDNGVPDRKVTSLRTLKLTFPEPTKQMTQAMKLHSRFDSDHSEESAETAAQSSGELDGQSSQSISDLSERHSERSLYTPWPSEEPHGMPLELHVKTNAGHLENVRGHAVSECSLKPSATSPTETVRPTVWL